MLDGGANRKTKRIFRDFYHSKFEKYMFKENSGPYITRGKAIELSKTEWYCQLDGDDILPPNALKNISLAIEKFPEAEFIYGDSEHFSNNHSAIIKPLKDHNKLSTRPLFNGASPIKISLFNDLGGFSNEFFINADWDFWLSVYEKNIIGIYTDNVIYKRRKNVNSVGNKYLSLRPKIVEKIIARHPKYFASQKRKNMARFFVNKQMAKHYKSNGNRKRAAKFARKAIKFGETTPIFNTIFLEEKMSIIRYFLRRVGRFL